MRRPALLVVLVLVACGACDAFSPDVGAPLVARCTEEDSDPDETVSFRDDILPLFEEYCVRCHTPGGDSPVGIEVGGLDLSSYSTLRAGGVVSGSTIVLGGDPCASVLRQKLGPAPPFGGRMPLNGPPFLGEGELQLVHDWIAEGAREN